MLQVASDAGDNITTRSVEILVAQLDTAASSLAFAHAS